MLKYNGKIDWPSIVDLAIPLSFVVGLLAIPCGRWIHRNHEDIESISTLFVAIFTIVLACFTIRLASATDKLVIGSENTAKRQLRAYIGMESANITQLGESMTPQVELVIRNFGQTPAHDVISVWQIKMNKFPAPNNLFPDVTHDIDKPARLLNPASTVNYFLELPKPLTQGTWAAFLRGELAIYVFGETTYRDIFDEEHSTQYRHIVGGNAPIRGEMLTDYHGSQAT